MADDDIIWEDPPEDALTSAPKGRYKDFARRLRENPNKWAVLPGGPKKSADSAKGTATNIRTGRVQGFTKDHFETAVDGVKVYVRFIGLAGQGEPAQDDVVGESGVEATSGRGAMVRQWARAQGIDVPNRGRLPQAVIDKYEAATRSQ